MAEKVRAIIMLEILGKPADHINKVLSEIIDKMAEDKELEVVSRKMAEPKQVEGKEVFTSFAEVEIETTLQKLLFIGFAFMPSHIEIISPEDLKIKSFDLNIVLTELLKKLHQYDEIARGVLIERQILAKQIREGKIKLEVKNSDLKKEVKKTAKKKVTKRSKKKVKRKN